MFCGVCQKSFSGPVSFKQHEESEKHKKKVQLAKLTGSYLEASQANFPLRENSCPISCSICLLNFDGINNYQKHVNSMEHANVVQNKETVKQKNEIERKLELEDNLVNQILQDTSDPNIYQPSLKKMKAEECSENTNSSYASHGIAEVFDVPIQIGNNFFCQICSVNCSGAIPYSQHINSQGHKKKQSIKEMHNKFEVNQCGEGEPSFSITEMTNKAAEACALNNLRCETCNKCFSGPIPYDQHLKSNVHQKKLREKRLLEEMGCARSNLNTSTGNDSFLSEDSLDSSLIEKDGNAVINLCISGLKCDLCNKAFNGQSPFEDHMKSVLHKKKESEKLSLESGNMNKGTEQYYCSLCFIQCNSVASFQQHLSSAAHHSKQLSSNLKSNENPKLFNSDDDTQNDLSKDSTMDDSNLISDGTFKNLMSLEELNVTLISSDQEVKFE